MIRAYRICQERYAAHAFDGEGARQFGGRWNNKGTPMVYLAGSIALAQLEMLVHLDAVSVLMQRYIIFPVDIPKALIADASENDVPRDWDSSAGKRQTAEAGDAWARGRTSTVLKVPSAVVPMEFNFIANPLHPEFNKLRISDAMSLRFDSRLIK